MAALSVLAAMLAVSPGAGAGIDLPHRVPPGFVIEKVAGDPAVVFPMFAAFDDRGRLFVAESSGLDLYAELTALTRKCRVSLLEDRDGDGRFETSRVFADKLVFPMGLAWRDGRLYVADPPHVVALEDTDGEGKADRRVEVLGSFGHKDNGSLHGLVFGPDGLLYLTMGSPDGYHLVCAGGGVLEGESGALIRARPDGSHVEVLCRGFENLVEVAFLPSGEIIGTDNWFQLPQGGVRDALVHLVDGGLYPRHEDRKTRYPVTGPPLPAMTLFPAVALSGLVRYRGRSFPEGMQDPLFSAQHNARKVSRHLLSREGSTFRSEDFDFVTSTDPDFHPSDVLEDADGSLLVVDTGGWYVQHCPTGKIRDSRAPGGIYRVRHVGAAAASDPWGLGVGWDRASTAQLCELLGDFRPVVRDKSTRALSSRGEAALSAIGAVLEGPAAQVAKEHALWALHGIPAASALPPVRRMLKAPDRDLAVLAARVLALRDDRESDSRLRGLLSHAAPEVRMAAAEALARCGSAASVPAILAALSRESSPPDRYLEHSLILALHGLADAAALEAALDHPHGRVQKAALILLDQPPRKGAPREAVLQRASAADPELRRTALEILGSHREWAGSTAEVARSLIEKPGLDAGEQLALGGFVLELAPEGVMAELIAAALLGREAKTPDATRILLLEVIGQGGIADPPRPWVDAIAELVRAPPPPALPPAVREAAVRAAAILSLPALDAGLLQLVEAGNEPADLRVEAFRAVVGRHPVAPRAVLELLISRLDASAEPLVRMSAVEVLGRSRLESADLERVLATARGDARVSPAALLPALERGAGSRGATAIVEYLEAALRAGWRPREADLLKVVEKLPADLSERGKRLIDLARQGGDALRGRLAGLEPLLEGGDASRGRAVFTGKKTACSTCHRIGADGGQVGPDLTKVGMTRSGRDILESVVVPSSTFAQGYESWTVVTAGGQVLSGVIARQTPGAIVLRSASGAEAQVPRDAIQTLERQEASLMPEGLERAMTQEEMRDLLAYLVSLK